jgi:hypothetical protein
MSDDLVERIELWMCNRRGEDQCGCPSCVILAEAAAEIRSLREQVARAKAAEHRARLEGMEIMREKNRPTFQRIKEAADAILAPLCAEVGRWLIEGKDEPDMVKVMHDYGVVIPVRAFADLYDATDYTILAAILAEHTRAKAMDEQAEDATLDDNPKEA